MKRAATPSHLRRFPLLPLRALVALGLLGFVACASFPLSEDSPTDRFAQACSALDAGDLDGAARHLRALREESPELPEVRLLESLVTLRRERPALGWHEAFIQAWNDVGRPDLREASLLPAQAPDYAAAEPRVEARDSSEGEDPLLVLALDPDATRGSLILEHLAELDPPELIFAADFFLEHESLPAALRPQASQALRKRLSELAVSAPRAMQYPALLLMDGSTPEAPFTPEELQGIEALATLPDWRETDFQVLFERALSRFQAAGHAQPTHAAFTVAVSALATRPAYLLFKRTEASREVLSAAQLQQLGKALWRIGSRMAEESTLLERILGARMMVDGAQLVGDEALGKLAAAMRDEAREAADAMRQAVPELWPLRALNKAHMDALTRDEMGCMLRFQPPTPGSHSAP